MRTHRHPPNWRGRATRLSFCALLASLVLTGCSERQSGPVGPTNGQKAIPEKAAINAQLTDGINFYAVPDPGWPATPWDGDLVVYAHGYYAPGDLLWTPDRDQVAGTPIASIVNNLGFAYASTSYRRQGLVVPEAVEDVVALVNGFVSNNHGVKPSHIYLVGPSEGGLITTLAVEQYSNLFSGGMAMCAPIGDFRKQMEYFGDFHLLFSYFYPAVVPGTPNGIPPVENPIPVTLTQWEQTYKPQIQSVVGQNPSLTGQLLRVSRASINPADPGTIQKTVVDILWYNLFATNDAIITLHGTPFNNKSPLRVYRGSDNDIRLNLTIPRISATPAALAAIEAKFQTSGRLRLPLVTLHTTGDPIIPYWHAILYQTKAAFAGSSLRHSHIPILRYGHCEFQVYEVLAGFALLVLKVTGGELFVTQKAVPDVSEQNRLLQLARQHGATPTIQRVQDVSK